MFSFLHPLAFAALLGLVVPLLIHLWERRQGRRVLVGSIRWLKEADEQRISHWRLTDLWRLLLRTLIVVLFVFLLAGAAWQSRENNAGRRHWVLLAPGLQAAGPLLVVLDSLRDQGLPLRVLTSGFPDWTPDAGAGAFDTTANYWSLLRELCRQRPAPDTVTIFGDPLLRNFQGERPRLPLVVRWQALPVDGAEPFLVRAWRDDAGIEILLALSGAEGTVFQRTTVPSRPGQYPLPDPLPPLVLLPGAGPQDWQAQLSGSRRAPVRVTDLPQRTVRIFYDQAMAEAQRYLRAALRAAAAFTGLAIEVTWLPLPDSELPLPEAGDWLFWLSEQPLPESAAERWAPQLVQYRPSPLWQENFFQAEGDRIILQRRLAPQETATIFEDRLPAELIGILFGGERYFASANDQRFIAEDQLGPEFSAGKRAEGAAASVYQSLHLPLWLLLLVLFLVERLLAGKIAVGK